MVEEDVKYMDPNGVVDEKFLLNVWLAAQPLELATLQREGYLVKVGTWWKIAKSLPDHVGTKVCRTKETPEGALVQFSKSTKQAQTMAERIGVNWQGPRPR